jgi:uncharacterized DUF497 family protein
MLENVMRVVEEAQFRDFDWDPDKRERTLVERNLDFIDAARALLEPHLEQSSDRDGEPRTLAVCMQAGRIIVVVFTLRGEVCRIISVRPARKNEQRAYREIFGG